MAVKSGTGTRAPVSYSASSKPNSGTPTSPDQTVELPELEAFKSFYVSFRSDAFRETAGTMVLDTVRSESETAAQQLGEELQDNVFAVLFDSCQRSHKLDPSGETRLQFTAPRHDAERGTG